MSDIKNRCEEAEQCLVRVSELVQSEADQLKGCPVAHATVSRISDEIDELISGILGRR